MQKFKWNHFIVCFLLSFMSLNFIISHNNMKFALQISEVKIFKPFHILSLQFIPEFFFDLTDVFSELSHQNNKNDKNNC